MKNVYYAFALIFFILGLFLAVQNVINVCMYQVLLDTIMGGSLMPPALMMLLIGFVSGMFFVLGLKVQKKAIDDYDDNLNF